MAVINSNTTLVNVKSNTPKARLKLFLIQIQHLLMLNHGESKIMPFSKSIQIQHLLMLNLKAPAVPLFPASIQIQHLLMLNCKLILLIMYTP